VHTETYEVSHLEDCMSQLSGRARELIRLGYIEARGHDEVARALNISEGNARVLRHRTLASLRECMSKRMSWEAA
jgi:RNA polymerase sigma factor (sigma-70 family)